MKVRYCDFPGERLIKSAKFEVNGTKLDEYDTHAYVFHRRVELKESA